MTPRNNFTPLCTEQNGETGPTIRILTLQHVNIVHLRKVLAREIAEIIGQKTANSEQMERVRKGLKHYGEFDYLAVK
jgi:hypothetical protein